MSFFPKAQGLHVSNSQFVAATTTTTTTNNTYLNGPTGIDILRDSSALEAIHDSSSRSNSSRCFPGTREQYIEDIVGSATPSLGHTPLPIYWMKGPAGVGKSAIAQTCAERLQEVEALGASFFFSINGHCKPEKFFPSIAYQLSTRHPVYRDLIDKKVLQDKALLSKAMRFQFQYLIGEPLREMEKHGKGIRKGVQIFVDGLDECEGIDAQCEIIGIVAAAVSEGALPLRWTFFSRPEPHIEAAFSTVAAAPHCYKAVLPISTDADGEIELYLKNAFNSILQRRNPSAQTPWPSSEEVKTIVRGAGGLFIYATTVLRFVDRPDSLSPEKRLICIIDFILERRSHASTSTDTPFAELDAFYTLILQRVPKEAFPSVHLFLALHCQLWKLGAMSAANMLGMSKNDFETICHHLSAVVRFEEPGKKIDLDPSLDTSRAYTQISQGSLDEVSSKILGNLGGQAEFYHKSFEDFLLDTTRSKSYCVKSSEELANHFVEIHLNYDQTFCWRGSELVLAPRIPDSAASLSYPYTNEFVNSMLKAKVHYMAGDEDAFNFPLPRGARELATDRDFRKWLYTSTTLELIGGVWRYLTWGLRFWRKVWLGTYISYISLDQFPKPAVTEFKLMIRRREQTGIIRRYYPSLTSKIKSRFRDQRKKSIESALYQMGRGEKAIFWYWEINYKLRCYREFRSIDLIEGKKKFREEDFDSWPKLGHDSYESKVEGGSRDVDEEEGGGEDGDAHNSGDSSENENEDDL